jgi:hypothetical protein
MDLIALSRPYRVHCSTDSRPAHLYHFDSLAAREHHRGEYLSRDFFVGILWLLE